MATPIIFKTGEDEKRDKHLKQSGFTVMRFSGHQVMKDLRNVLRTLDAFIESHSGPLSLNPPEMLRDGKLSKGGLGFTRPN